MLGLGIIGCGARAAWIIASLRRLESEIELSIADPNPAVCRDRLGAAGVPHDTARFYPTADALLEHAHLLDGIIIGTRCDLHTPMAVKVAPTGLPLFLEKPVAISTEQVRALQQAYLGRESSVVVSFPLRLSPLFQNVLELVRAGRIGTINQIQASNFVPYGGVYFGQWYRDYDVTGGLWLQKATHDFDYINQIVGAAPSAVIATSTRKIYGGAMSADLRCSQCPATDECAESPEAIDARDDDGGMGRGDHACAFSASIKHHDAGSALITYADGTHAAYSQNFVTRRSAGMRGARITGYLGTLSFDWYTDVITLVEHHGKGLENIKVEVADGHHGGDAALVRNFLNVMRDTEASRSQLRDGLLSAAMCLAARTSEVTQCVQSIELPAPPPDEPKPQLQLLAADRSRRRATPA